MFCVTVTLTTFSNFYFICIYRRKNKMHKYLSYISPKTMLIPTRTCYFAKKSSSFFAKEDDPSISGYSKKTVIGRKYDVRM